MGLHGLHARGAALFLGCAALGCGPGLGAPPEPETSCAGGKRPSEGEPRIYFSDPTGGALALAPDALLAIEVGPQGGQHVMVGVQQFTEDASFWFYTMTFEQDAPARDAPASYPSARGAGSASIETCGAGWTETIAPVFMALAYGGEPPPEGEGPTIAGVLRVAATSRSSDERVSAALRVRLR